MQDRRDRDRRDRDRRDRSRDRDRRRRSRSVTQGQAPTSHQALLLTGTATNRHYALCAGPRTVRGSACVAAPGTGGSVPAAGHAPSPPVATTPTESVDDRPGLTFPPSVVHHLRFHSFQEQCRSSRRILRPRSRRLEASVVLHRSKLLGMHAASTLAACHLMPLSKISQLSSGTRICMPSYA